MMKTSIVFWVAAIALSQTSNAARPVDAPDLCEIQIEAFWHDMDSVKTDADKEQVKKRWRNKRPSWKARCVSHFTKEKQ